jgi:rhombotail lipoprotein
MKRKTWLNLGMAAALATLAAGCESWDQRESHRANSLYNYLYADQPGHVDAAAIPVLSLPLRVGIAFVPPDLPRKGGGDGPSEEAALSENQKMDLMQRISAQFKGYPFVKSIEQIPTAYLSPRGGFANLDQIRTMYGVDVMVLLSYDQVQFTDQGLLSLSYWTIVGAYVIQGEKNDTQTMLDGAVYDIASRQLLFRAPGLSKVKGSATYVNLSQQLRHDSERGFQDAATNLVAALKIQLQEFQQRVKNAPADFKIVNQPGYTGASALGGAESALACAMGACYLWTRRNRRCYPSARQ